MSAEQQEEILEIFKKHKWPRVCRRLNIVSPEHRQTDSNETIRKTLIECKSQSFSANNKGMRKIYEKIVEMLPDDFERGPNLCFTINHNVTCHPHKDAGNVGPTLAMFLGDFTGGELLLETGEVFSEKGVWHRYSGSDVLHWNQPHVGEKFSIIVHNNKRSITWGKSLK